MAKNETKRITCLDTSNYNGYVYEDYVDYCGDNNLKIGEEDSKDFYDWQARMRDYDVEDFWDNLKNTDFGECEVSGSLGLWWGTPNIEPKRFDNLYDAVRECIDNSTLDLCVYLENGILYVDAIHHDGTNSFVIKPMIKGKRFPKYLW